MSKCSEIHYLVEYTDNMSVKMDKNDAELFLILSNKNLKDSLKKRANESMTDSIKSKIDEHNQDVNKIITKEILDTISQEEIDKITNDGLLNFFDEIEDEDESIKKTLKKEYKLDDILDKITEKGISSLTKEEKEYLNKLSK
jgi:hypothetical protein